MPQSAFSAFRALLPSANYSAEWSGWVWQPSADSNFAAPEGCHTQSRKFEFKQNGRQTAITICRGLTHPTGWAALPSYQGIFSRVEKPSDDINNCLFLMNKKGLKSENTPDLAQWTYSQVVSSANNKLRSNNLCWHWRQQIHSIIAPSSSHILNWVIQYLAPKELAEQVAARR